MTCEIWFGDVLLGISYDDSVASCSCIITAFTHFKHMHALVYFTSVWDSHMNVECKVLLVLFFWLLVFLSFSNAGRDPQTSGGLSKEEIRASSCHVHTQGRQPGC